ncbi:unnamed protein product [Lepidochelys kempii]
MWRGAWGGRAGACIGGAAQGGGGHMRAPSVSPTFLPPPPGLNLTLRWSWAKDTSLWQHPLQVWAGPSGYSSLDVMEPGDPRREPPTLYLIYEKGRNQSIESISLVKISLSGSL